MIKAVEMNVKDIIPYENNPRDNREAVDKVAESIREFGFLNPIILDTKNVIIAGHTRLKACIKLGIKQVPVIIADDLTEDQVRAFRLIDNKVAEGSVWDEDLLTKELDGLEGFDMTVFGFMNPGMDKATASADDFAGKELDLGDYGDEQFEHECPYCGFKFNTKE